MARPLRIEFPGALYHVTSRGNGGEDIVFDDRDRERRLKWLERAVEQHDWRLHAFALMSNHDHLLVETPEANLSRGMKLLNGAYTQYFNVRYRRRGHVLQGRYKAQVIEEDGHWSEVSRYIHLNPVRAGMVTDPLDSPWTSFPGYCRRSRALPWVTYDRVLAEHGPGSSSARRRRYAKFVRWGIEKDLRAPWQAAWHGLVIGSEEFLERVRGRGSVDGPDPEVTGSRQLLTRRPVETVASELAKVLGVEEAAWSSGRRSNRGERAVAAYALHRLGGYRRGEVAEALGYASASGVTKAQGRVESQPKLMKRAKKVYRKVEMKALGDA